MNALIKLRRWNDIYDIFDLSARSYTSNDERFSMEADIICITRNALWITTNDFLPVLYDDKCGLITILKLKPNVLYNWLEIT